MAATAWAALSKAEAGLSGSIHDGAPAQNSPMVMVAMPSPAARSNKAHQVRRLRTAAHVRAARIAVASKTIGLSGHDGVRNATRPMTSEPYISQPKTFRW